MLCRYLQEWFNDIFVKCIAKLGGRPKQYQNDIGVTIGEEEIVGVTREDLSEEMGTGAREDPSHIRKKYLDPLVNLGLVKKSSSVRDGRNNIYSFLENNQEKNDDTDSNNNKDKVLVRNPTLYPSKNVIVESLIMVVNYDADDPSIFEKKSEYEILDENGREITPDELADRYFANPEDYFDKAF